MASDSTENSDTQSDVEELSDSSLAAAEAKPGAILSSEFRHVCTICETEKTSAADLTQLLPCMHMFCNDCLFLHKQFGAKVCPQLHCYSTLQPNLEEHRLNLCENDLCAHRFGFPTDLFKLTLCKHEICGNCFEEAVHRDPRLCPIDECGVVLEEDDEKDTCDICKALTENDKLLSTLCCNVIVCQNCFIQAWERSDKPRTSTEVRCPPGDCLDKKKGTQKKNQDGSKKGSGKKQVTTPSLAKCKGAPDCGRVALRNFPSEQECEHDVCLQCLDRMIADCQVSDSMPMCPNDRCHLPYRFESVASLKALLPDRAKYFAGLALELNQGYEAIKDDSVADVQTCISGFKAKERILQVKCNVSEDEEGPTIVTYCKDGSLGGFIRELRRTMKIMPTDKVYGYFVRRDEGGDEQLVINQSTFQKSIATYQFDSETLIIIDVTGIVMAKTNANKT